MYNFFVCVPFISLALLSLALYTAATLRRSCLFPFPPAELKMPVFTHKIQRLRATQTLLRYLGSETRTQSPTGGVTKHFECRPALRPHSTEVHLAPVEALYQY